MSGTRDLTPEHLKFGPYDLERGGRALARDVAFELMPGRYLELTGANGSGKTTLLRLIAGQVKQQQVKQEKETSRNLSVFYFAHQTGFRPELQVADQLVLSLQIFGISLQPVDILHILETAGLRKQAYLRVGELSHGQHRRLLLVLMAKSRCTLWLIDEPLNALDEQAKGLFAQLLTAHMQQGGSAIIATHTSLQQALPELAAYLGGSLVIAGQFSQFQSLASVDSDLAQTIEQSAGLSPTKSLLWSMGRELKLIAAKPVDIVWPVMFHLMIVSMFPLAIGAQPEVLLRIAPGIFWMSAMLAVLMAASRLFELDDEHGVLVQLNTSRFSLAALTAGKFAASLLSLGIPLALLSYPMGLLYHLPLSSMHHLCLSLLFGMVSLIAFSGLFAALGLMARQAQVMMSLLAFPVFVPLLIFGTAAVNHTEKGFGQGLDWSSPLFVLVSLAVLSMLTIPLITAKVLELVVE